MTRDPTTRPGLSAEKQQYLKLLSIGNYVLAGFAFLFGFFPVIHFVVGVAMISGLAQEAADSARIPGMLIGGLFVGLSLAFIATAWTYAYFMVLAGKALAARERHLLCMVMAAISCMFAPIGTVVGVFTILLLLDDEVKAEFGEISPTR